MSKYVHIIFLNRVIFCIYLVSNDKQLAFTLGIQNASTWMIDPSSGPVLTYRYGTKTVSITMSCSNNVVDALDVVGETTLNHFTMRLRSHCACWNGCATPKLSTTTPSMFFDYNQEKSNF
jgi:hypothetical protein